mmetsp:Transcript_20703/g.42576  ORF Transcript_20703/g.42576 Transcript_20703/m.42576 type:complete len:217 (-) Transcript_20703:17-667(-)
MQRPRWLVVSLLRCCRRRTGPPGPPACRVSGAAAVVVVVAARRPPPGRCRFGIRVRPLLLPPWRTTGRTVPPSCLAWEANAEPLRQGHHQRYLLVTVVVAVAAAAVAGRHGGGCERPGLPSCRVSGERAEEPWKHHRRILLVVGRHGVGCERPGPPSCRVSVRPTRREPLAVAAVVVVAAVVAVVVAREPPPARRCPRRLCSWPARPSPQTCRVAW